MPERRRPKQRKKEDLSLFALFLIVLIVYGVYFFLNSSGILKEDPSELSLIYGYKASADQKASESLKGLAVSAACLSYKQDADKAFGQMQLARQKYGDSGSNFYVISFKSAKYSFEEYTNRYISCISS